MTRAYLIVPDGVDAVEQSCLLAVDEGGNGLAEATVQRLLRVGPDLGLVELGHGTAALGSAKTVDCGAATLQNQSGSVSKISTCHVDVPFVFCCALLIYA